jgi:hypothetical protein
VGKSPTEQPRWPARRRRWSFGRECPVLPLAATSGRGKDVDGARVDREAPSWGAAIADDKLAVRRPPGLGLLQSRHGRTENGERERECG